MLHKIEQRSRKSKWIDAKTTRRRQHQQRVGPAIDAWGRKHSHRHPRLLHPARPSSFLSQHTFQTHLGRFEHINLLVSTSGKTPTQWSQLAITPRPSRSLLHHRPRGPSRPPYHLWTRQSSLRRPHYEQVDLRELLKSGRILHLISL